MTPPPDGDSGGATLHKQNEHLHLRQQSDALMRQNEQLTQDLSEQSKRHDTIVMRMTQQLDRAHLQIEDLRKRRSVWQRIKAVFVPEAV